MNKYHAKKCVVDDVEFDSELEAKYYTEVLKPMLINPRACVIFHPRYELQPKFKLDGKVYQKVEYEADFEVMLSDGSIQVIDIKGMITETAALKRKLFLYKHQDKKLIWLAYVKKHGGWIEVDELKKIRRSNKK